MLSFLIGVFKFLFIIPALSMSLTSFLLVLKALLCPNSNGNKKADAFEHEHAVFQIFVLFLEIEQALQSD